LTEAFKKYTVLKKGTEKTTTTSKIVAMRVTIKPGVAGRKQAIEWEGENTEMATRTDLKEDDTRPHSGNCGLGA